MKLKTIVLLSILTIPTQINAQDSYSITVNESYDDMTFSVESAILDRGLNIDTISHVGDMLARTAADVGANQAIFTNASVFNFCSAVLSRDAMELDPAKLKARFGKNICFWGGVDTRQVMPRGTTKDVGEEVALRIKQMGPGGGYVLAAVHNLQPEVPAANIVELFRTGKESGKYPLA